MIRILADDKIPFLQGVLEPYADIKYLPGNQINAENAKFADSLLIRTRTKCTPALLDGSAVKFIATATIGFDHIDTQYCEKNNIAWTNAPGCNSSSVQQYIAAALLLIAGKHDISLKNKTIGIVGVGNVGSKVEHFARVMGMNVLLCDPPRAAAEGSAGFVKLGKLLRESDFITLHVPLTFVGEDATYHMIDDKVFGRIRKDSWFINAARGEVVETSAFRKKLDKGSLQGAVIDVWENEPDIDTSLMSQAFIATPHIAGYSTDGKANGTAMAVNSLAEFFGLPLRNWYPGDIPAAENPLVTIECRGRSVQEIVWEAVRHTYDILADDSALRQAPAGFEKQRGNYRLRREFKAYDVILKNAPGEAAFIIRNLGFRKVTSE